MRGRVHNRSPNISMVALSRIKSRENYESDPIFAKLVRQDLLGKMPNAISRMEISRITSGFYRHDGTHWSGVQLKPRQAINSCIAEIKGGSRPLVEVYWSPFTPDGGGYVCPDSECVLAAYTKAGISIVPVCILKPINKSDVEGALWAEKISGKFKITRSIASGTSDFMVMPAEYHMSHSLALSSFKAKMDDCAEKIKTFHAEGKDEIHYHQMLHAVARRHARSLDSIAALLNVGRIEHASFIVRACYEAYLNFYIDWLSPNFLGSRIQYISMMRGKSVDQVDVGALSSIMNNVREKARLSNLGVRFYDAVYPSLSDMIHQSYYFVESEGLDFADKANPGVDADGLVELANVITTSLLKRLLNEVGQ